MLTFWKPVEGTILLIVLFCLQVIYDRETSRSRGFGFVTMASQAEASAAKQTLDGYVSFLLSFFIFLETHGSTMVIAMSFIGGGIALRNTLRGHAKPNQLNTTHSSWGLSPSIRH